VVIALFWVNVSATTYRIVWQTPLSVSVGDVGVSLSLRGWINSGLMAFFFFVVGLEARREFDLGELRQRRRVALPLLAGLGGMLAPILLFLAINAGRPSAHAWGAVMTTDTALTLGVLALAGRRLPGRLRVFLLTVTVVDDIVGIVVIATVYSESVNLIALLVAAGVFATVLLVRALRIHIGLIYLALAAGCWLAVLKSGIDPIVVGLAMGLIAYAYPAGRSDLERASDLFRRFREQPTPQLARAARTGVRLALSPNVALGRGLRAGPDSGRARSARRAFSRASALQSVERGLDALHDTKNLIPQPLCRVAPLDAGQGRADQGSDEGAADGVGKDLVEFGTAPVVQPSGEFTLGRE